MRKDGYTYTFLLTILTPVSLLNVVYGIHITICLSFSFPLSLLLPPPSSTSIHRILHLPAHRNDNIVDRFFATGASHLNLLHNGHAVDDFAKNDVFVIEEGRGGSGDEELRAVGVRARVLGHF